MNYTYDELLSVIYNELLPVYQKHNPGVTFDELITKAKKAKLPALCRTYTDKSDTFGYMENV